MHPSELKKFYVALYDFFGPQHWWPGKTKFEVCIGAILTQNTSWKNVEKALSTLRAKKKLSPLAIDSLSHKELAELIRSAGYYNQKASTIKAFCKHIIRKYSGSINAFLKKHQDVLREELLSIKGIGTETADSIILYAANKPTFVVDAYTERIMARVFGLSFKNRHELKVFFESNIPKDAKVYNEFHALLVALAKNFCRKKPACAECPINKNCCYYNSIKN